MAKQQAIDDDCRPTDCPSAAASAAKTWQNATDLVREAVSCTGVFGGLVSRYRTDFATAQTTQTCPQELRRPPLAISRRRTGSLSMLLPASSTSSNGVCLRSLR